jgi:hypothetical protein
MNEDCLMQAYDESAGTGTMSTACRNERDPVYAQQFPDWQNATAHQQIFKNALIPVSLTTGVLLLALFVGSSELAGQLGSGALT